MKKTYITPATVVVMTMQEQPIAGSLTTSHATFYDKGAEGAAMGREDNGWDIWGTEDESEE